MTTVRNRLVELLPLPYAVGGDSVLGQLLNAFAVELEAYAEDLDRLRRTHWVELVYRLEDLDRLAAVLGTTRLSWEDLPTFRTRLLALAAARLAGAVGPNEIRGFVFGYLSRAQDALRATYVLGLGRYDATTAFQPDARVPAFRPLALVENPLRERHSQALRDRGGRVPYLLRWEEHNRGLVETFARITITGLPQGRTAVPVLANLTTGDLIGYRGVLRVGQRLHIDAADATPPDNARATLDGTRDVTDRLFSLRGFRLGEVFGRDQLDPVPRLARMARGANAWIFLSIGLYDVRGLDHVFFAIADAELREGTFDGTRFDHALFPSGPVAAVDLRWTEQEPASFQVRVPWQVVVEESGPPRYRELAEALRTGVVELHAAGVQAEVVFDPFTESQPQRVSVQLPWVVIPPERGPSGVDRDLALGARFGESAFASTRFE